MNRELADELNNLGIDDLEKILDCLEHENPEALESIKEAVENILIL